MSETLSDLAIETIRNILTDPKASPWVRLKAALAILKSETMATRPVTAAKPEPKPQPQVQTIRREGPKIGRNETCPCGTGLKFKHCCLNRARQEAATSISAAAA